MRTFYLGLGAQKAGTTWLFRQICKAENFRPGLCKEYHLFDYLHLGREGARANASKRIKNFDNWNRTISFKNKCELIDSFYDDQSRYYQYMDSLLAKEEHFTVDITPSYCGLSAEVLSVIKEEFNKRDILVKVIFSMREPICRLDSEIRMAQRRRANNEQLSNREIINKMENRASNKDEIQGKYGYTVGQIDNVFKESEVLYVFFEDLFSGAYSDKLASFFSLPAELFDIDQKINSFERSLRFPIEQLEKWRLYFDSEYQFVESRFNFDTEKWKSTLYKELGHS